MLEPCGAFRDCVPLHDVSTRASRRLRGVSVGSVSPSASTFDEPV